jgi:uncharacterized repeat protein (TIGR01451 family)
MRAFAVVCSALALLSLSARPAGAQDRPDLTVTLAKAGAQPEVPTRTNVAFVATVANGRAPAASSVLTRVTMPAGFTNLSTTVQPGSGTTCTISGSIVNCTTPTIAGNSQTTFRVSSTAPATITGLTQSFSLAAIVDPGNTIPESGGANSNNSDQLSVTIATRADLGVSLAGPVGSLLTTQVAPDIFYVVAATNTGDRAASNLLVRGTLPKDVAFVRVQDNTLGTCLQNSTASNGALNVNCTLSSLAPGATGRVRILGRVLGAVPDRVQVTFAAAVDPANTVPERNENDNTAFMQTTLRAPSDVQATDAQAAAKGGSAPSLVVENPGDIACANFDITVTVNVRNAGPYASPATTVTTTWPAGFSAITGTCFDRCNVPALTPGQALTVRLAAHVTRATGLVQPTFVVDAAQQIFDPIVSNNRVTQVACGG